MLNYYEILEVREDASQETIQGAYRALSKKYHPDTCKGDKKTGEAKFKLINEAYEVLSNVSKRTAYDRENFNTAKKTNVECWQSTVTLTLAEVKIKIKEKEKAEKQARKLAVKQTSKQTITKQPNGYITIGNSKDNVKNILGAPNDANHYVWNYLNSIIVFDIYEKVDGWINRGNLPVSMGSKTANGIPITIGSSKKAVVESMGTPEEIIGVHYWHYGDSYITFDTSFKVLGWNNKGNLPVTLGSKTANGIPITIGSSKKAVVESMGTPEVIIGVHYWYYGNSNITFDSYNNVSGWKNSGDLLVTLGSKTSNGDLIAIGSLKEHVVAAMGTPDNVSNYSWGYGNSNISFDFSGKVSGWNNRGDLPGTIG